MYNTVSTYDPPTYHVIITFYVGCVCKKYLALYEDDNLEWNFTYEYYYLYL